MVFARADALVNLSERVLGAGAERAGCAWRTSARNRPATGCCTSIRKGTQTDQTLEAVEDCRRNGVIPELSFMLAPPQDPEGETETDVRVHPPDQTGQSAAEIMVYIYTPLPPDSLPANSRSRAAATALLDLNGRSDPLSADAGGMD